MEGENVARSIVNVNYIAARRKELGLTQEELAKKLGMNSAPAYNKYEKETYQFLLNALQCGLEIYRNTAAGGE